MCCLFSGLADTSLMQQCHETRSLFACIEMSVSDEACNDRAFHLDNMTIRIAPEDPIVWQAIEDMNRRRRAVPVGGRVHLPRFGILEGRSTTELVSLPTTGLAAVLCRRGNSKAGSNHDLNARKEYTCHSLRGASAVISAERKIPQPARR